MQEQAIVMEYRRLRSAHEHTNIPSPANKQQTEDQPQYASFAH